MGLTKNESIYLILTFLFAFFLACILLLIKIKFKDSTFISIFFAMFFLTFYFFQPFLLCLDQLKAYTLYYSSEKPDLGIHSFMQWEFEIVGYTGTLFSNVILPIHTDYFISGYETRCQKFKDAIIRFFKKKQRIAYFVIFVLYVIISYITYLAKGKDKDIEEKSFGAAKFLLNCLVLLDFFKALWYLGAYFPLLINQLRIEWDTLKKTNYYVQLSDTISETLEEDKKKQKKYLAEIYFIIILKAWGVIQKEEDKKLINKAESNKDNYETHSDDKKEKKKELIEEENNLEEEINEKNYKVKYANAFRKLKKVSTKIPKKFYEWNRIIDKAEQTNSRCYNLFPIIMFLFGLSTFIFEISLLFYDYEGLSPSLDFTSDYFSSLFISYLYFVAVYYSVLQKNSLTSTNIYGIKQSDSLCLLNFSEKISGLITPLSFLCIGTKAMGIFELRDKLSFMETFSIPIVENLFIEMKFDEVYNMYISIRLLVISIAFISTLTLKGVAIRNCCKEDSYFINWKINDKNFCVLCDCKSDKKQDN